jgi:hypothetical protein
MRRRALFSLLTAVAFATYSVYGLSLSYAAPKTAVVEVKPGVLTGKVMDLDEKPLAGKSVKILDAMGKAKYVTTTGTDGMYTIESLAAGTYTMVVADMQKVSLVVKSSSNNTVVNAMVPTTTEPYAAGDVGGLSAPLIVAIAGGVLLVGFAAWKISDSDDNTRTVAPPVSP